MRGVFSVDLEDWFHLNAVANPQIAFDAWPTLEERFKRSTDILLEVFDGKGAKITFFVLGWLAEKYPEYVRMLADRGHEIASHGYKHDLIFDLTPDEFRSDIQKSKRILEDLTGTPVIGYRAPSFSIKRENEWALDILIEEGFTYDSSLFPAVRGYGGESDYSRRQHLITRASGKLNELPVSTIESPLGNLPFCGGGYMRLYPYWFIRRGIKTILKEQILPVIYLHPRDVDPGQPRIRMPLKRYAKCYIGLRSTIKKVERLLGDFEWGTAEQAVRSMSPNGG